MVGNLPFPCALYNNDGMAILEFPGSNSLTGRPAGSSHSPSGSSP